MRSIRIAGQVAAYYLRQLIINPRLYASFGLFITLAILSIRPYYNFAAENAKAINALEPLIMMLSNSNLAVLLYVVPLVLLSDAPFFRSGQAYYIVRTKGRMRWLTGQIIYIICCLILSFAVYFAITVLLFSKQLYFADIWSQTYYRIAYDMLTVPGIQASKMLVENFAPLAASLHAVLLSIEYGAFLVLIMFLVNMHSKRRMGFLLAAVVHVIGRGLEVLGFPMLIKWYPFQNALLQNHSFGINNQYMELWQSHVYFILLITVLLICIWRKYRKQDMEVGDLDGTGKGMDLG